MLLQFIAQHADQVKSISLQLRADEYRYNLLGVVINMIYRDMGA